MWKLSYVVNFLTGGRPDELFCSRIYRRRMTVFVIFVNAATGNPKHCRRTYRWQRRHWYAKGNQSAVGEAQEAPPSQQKGA